MVKSFSLRGDKLHDSKFWQLTGSYIFGLRPAWVDTVSPYLSPSYYLPTQREKRPEILLTPAQLRMHDGTDPSLPLYLALNGTVYDVSANRRVYGPGGSYQFFSGRDAARAFITGCFKPSQGHLTHDLRGIDEAGLDKLRGWQTFYLSHKEYFKVGRVLNEPIDPLSPIPEDCKKKKPSTD